MRPCLAVGCGARPACDSLCAAPTRHSNVQRLQSVREVPGARGPPQDGQRGAQRDASTHVLRPMRGNGQAAALLGHPKLFRRSERRGRGSAQLVAQSARLDDERGRGNADTSGASPQTRCSVPPQRRAQKNPTSGPLRPAESANGSSAAEILRNIRAVAVRPAWASCLVLVAAAHPPRAPWCPVLLAGRN